MSSDAFKTAAATTKEDQAEVEKQQLELTDISNLLQSRVLVPNGY